MGGSELGAGIGGAAALPDDGGSDRRQCFALPDDRGFTLIRDPNREQAIFGRQRLVQDGARGVSLCAPDRFRILLHPAWLGELHGQRNLVHSKKPCLLVEEERTAAGRALIEGEEEVGHLSGAGGG